MKKTVKAKRAACKHERVIELNDGTKVCVSCEAVIKAVKS